MHGSAKVLSTEVINADCFLLMLPLQPLLLLILSDLVASSYNRTGCQDYQYSDEQAKELIAVFIYRTAIFVFHFQQPLQLLTLLAFPTASEVEPAHIALLAVNGVLTLQAVLDWTFLALPRGN